MDKLNELIGFGWPGSTVKIRAAPDAAPGDPWPGIEDSDAKMQTALDDLVEWADGVTPPTGAQVRAQIAAWQAAQPTQAELDAARKLLAANTAFDLADMKTTVDGFWILISALKSAGIPLGVPALDALDNDVAGKAGFVDLWKQRFESHLP